MTITQEQLEKNIHLVAALRRFWREITYDDGGESGQMVMTREAANAIESLVSEVERLREALKTIAEMEIGRGDGAVGDFIEEVREIASAALTQEQ